MGLYRDHILPRGIDRALNTVECRELRARVVGALHGVVVEIGFGSGLNLPHYPEAVKRIRAVEPALVGRRLARQRVRGCAIPVEYVGLDGQTIPLPTGSADAALSTWTLCSIPDVSRALHEIARVLRPGGRLHFLEHGLCPDEKVARWQRRLNPLQRRFAGGCQLVLPVADTLRAAGYRIERLDNYFMKKGPRFSSYMYEGVAEAPEAGER